MAGSGSFRPLCPEVRSAGTQVSAPWDVGRRLPVMALRLPGVFSAKRGSQRTGQLWWQPADGPDPRSYGAEHSETRAVMAESARQGRLTADGTAAPRTPLTNHPAGPKFTPTSGAKHLTTLTRLYRRHRHQEFVRFLKLIDGAVPAGLDLHLI